MNGAAKMMMISQARKGNQNEGSRNENNQGNAYSRMEYERNNNRMEGASNNLEDGYYNRKGDYQNRSEGRMERRDGRMDNETYPDTEMEARRRRDRRGRFAESEENPKMNYNNAGYEYESRQRGGTSGKREEMYQANDEYEESPEMRRSNMYALPRNNGPSSIIGFTGGEPEKMHYGEKWKQERHRQMGKYPEMKPLDQETAQEWTKGMKNADGSSGPHWTMEQAKRIMAQSGVSGIQPVEFWAVLNAVWSDYYSVAKKFGVDRQEFYVELAKAWINDDDAVEDKAAAYFEYVVQK